MKDIHGGDIWKASAISGASLKSLMDFSASINPLGLSKKAVEAVRKAASLIPPYPDPSSGALRAAIASFHSVVPDEVAAGNGSTEFIYLIPGVFRPRTALVVEPAFSEYRNALTLSGCRVDSLVLREDEGFSFDLKRFERKARKGFDLVFIGNPANPTGAPVEKEAILEAARMLERYGTTLVVDEAFADFSERLSVKREAVRRGNLVVMRSMTKFYAMAGLRLGYIIARKGVVKRFLKRLPPWSVNTVAAFAAEASLKDSAYIDKTLRWLNKERAFLFDGLNCIEGLKAYPSEANFLMAGIEKDGVSAALVRRELFREGILVRDLSAFRGLGPGYMRFAVRTRSENAALLAALKRFFKRY